MSDTKLGCGSHQRRRRPRTYHGHRLVTTVTTRADPAQMHQIAAQIEEDNPSWIVMFGIYTREFVAFPRFTVPKGTILTALYPDALPPRMRAVEATARPAAALAEADTLTLRLAG
jgi:hypothetical protein